MEKNRASIILFSMLIVVTALLGVVGWQVKSRLVEVGDLRVQVNQEKSAQADYEQLLADYSKYANVESEWRSLLASDEEDVARFAAGLENLATDYGLRLEIAFDDLPIKVDIGGKYGSGVKMELNIRGSYEGIMNFMDGMENRGYLVKEERILLSRGGEDQDYGMVVAAVLIMEQSK